MQAENALHSRGAIPATKAGKRFTLIPTVKKISQAYMTALLNLKYFSLQSLGEKFFTPQPAFDGHAAIND
jgi:hypothetical protein